MKTGWFGPMNLPGANSKSIFVSTKYETALIKTSIDSGYNEFKWDFQQYLWDD